MSGFRITSASLLVAIAGAPVWADTINVPADQPTIQAGINAAINGDEVVVAPGLYNEIIDFSGKAITVRSSGGADITTIDATGVPDPGDGVPVVRIDNGEGPDSVLEGFTITGGTGDTAKFSGTAVGGGVFCDVGVTATITSCLITGNSCDVGGGLFTNEASPAITDCTFLGNSAPGSGGGVFCYSSGTPAFTRCRFEGNTTVGGGGGAYVSDVLTTLTDCDFIGNVSTDPSSSGGGLLASGGAGDLVITGCRFLGNISADSGGGLVIAAPSATITMTNCVVSGNTAPSDGGGMYLSQGTFAIANCTVAGNTSGANGGGVRAFLGTGGTAENCIFWGNTDQGGTDNSAQFHGTNNVVPTYCIIQGGLAGDGNLDADPLFVDADGADNTVGTEDDDVRLTIGSPAIDSADFDAYVAAGGLGLDLDGNPRLYDELFAANTGVGAETYLDRGPYEFGSDASVPLIEQQPDSLVVEVGEIAFFFIQAPDATSYQWYKDDQPLSDDAMYSGTNASVLVVNVLDTSAEAVYSVQASDGTRSETSVHAGLVILPNPCLADMNNDGTLNGIDVGLFLQLYATGCP